MELSLISRINPSYTEVVDLNENHFPSVSTCFMSAMKVHSPRTYIKINGWKSTYINKQGKYT